ncbi:GNAT family N-acetyltransferase [Pontibacillus litoralis]|uniref:N-acetyltransferase domain-containing protein n=1 Tax=Pontibacillus litoralis JSM 072002 TaxID=1385512 RepID=A0A0A5FWY8_9BACI|nr:GNAT family N-acetyltransferase [Pontibacillus litoralis]KGX84424.1 hypothetical protein N784_13570 [Pontibacillus litoralis JSM 072002]
MNGVLHVRKLRMDDLKVLKQMETNIDDDYVIRIFPELISRENNTVFGLFNGDQMLAIAGYTTFHHRYAMLGRLRSDVRYRGNGHATYLLNEIIRYIQHNTKLEWVGAYTQRTNSAARQVIQKLDLKHMTTIQHVKLPLHHLQKDGEVWEKITNTDKIREYLLSTQNTIFSYEAYYPLPKDRLYLTDAYLSTGSFYIHSKGKRFMFIQEDIKDYVYAHVKYFWDDLHLQAGFWSTVAAHIQSQSNVENIWLNLSPTAASSLSSRFVMNSNDEWHLYEKWLT